MGSVFGRAGALAIAAAALAAAGLPAQAPAHRVVLDSAQGITLSAGANARLRTEAWSNYDFGAPVVPPAGVEYDQVYGLVRAFMHMRLDWRDRLTVFVQLKTALTTGRDLPGGDRAQDLDEADVQQAYLQARVPIGAWRLALTAGREDMSYGRERLVGVSDWSNTRRTFQGANVVASRPGLTIKAFWARPMQVRQYTWNIPDSTRAFYGVHLMRERPRFGVDAYWFGSRMDAARYNALPTSPEHRNTVGARGYSRGAARAGALDGELEVAYQFGTYGASDIAALLVAAQAGWRPTAATRIYLGFDYGSGDDSTAGRLGSVSQLYATGHSVLGYIDAQGRPNVVDGWAGTSLAHRGTTIQVDLHDFWRASTTDGFYGVGGTQARPAGNGLAAHVGSELDLTVRRAWRRNLPLQVGYSVYLPGTFLEQSGTSETMQLGYVQLGWVW